MLRHADAPHDGERQPSTSGNSIAASGSHQHADASSCGSPRRSPLVFLPPDRVLAAKASAAALAASAVRAGFAAGLRANHAQRPPTTGFRGPNAHASQGSPKGHVGSGFTAVAVGAAAVQTAMSARREVELSEEEEEKEEKDEVDKREEALFKQAVETPDESEESEQKEEKDEAEEQEEEQKKQKQEGPTDEHEIDEQPAKVLNEDGKKEQGMDNTLPACAQATALELGGSAPDTSRLMLAPQAAEPTVAESDDDVWEVLVQRTFINVVQKQRASAHTMSAPARLIATGSPEGRQRRGYSPARIGSRRRRRRNRRRSVSRQHGLLARGCAQPLGSLPPARARATGAADVTLVPLG